ncbi:MAG: hypothetical protein M1835_004740 [Candelina submexicana]|nr:MAG: hypothetical protein M1835_004740 [Candelina submexicana]
MDQGHDPETLRNAYSRLLDFLPKASDETYVLPSTEAVRQAEASLNTHLPSRGIGFPATAIHLLSDVLPGFNASSASPHYYGFVTGGTTPAAVFADNMVTACDQNVAVHLPDESVSTTVEERAAILLLELLRLDAKTWTARTFTTGATASNLLGLACGRNSTITKACQRQQDWTVVSINVSVAGIFSAMSTGKLNGIQILTTMPHSSLLKAASLVGLGHASVKTVGREHNPLRFDLKKLVDGLETPHTATIVVISCSEVNTGCFATESYEEMQHIRLLCDEYDAWLHVDGAFGLFGRALEASSEFQSIRNGSHGMELADSITGDAHKCLNVPYDCGFFFCRHPDIVQEVCQNPNAAYLNSGSTASIVSPLNTGIENSRRFRALPVYATLTAYGRSGYQEMLISQIRFARAVASYIMDHPNFELCSGTFTRRAEILANIYIVVLFRAKDNALNEKLVRSINATSKMYVSGTTWEGKPASRIAVANWRCDAARDIVVVKEVFDEVIKQYLQDA